MINPPISGPIRRAVRAPRSPFPFFSVSFILEILISNALARKGGSGRE